MRKAHIKSALALSLVFTLIGCRKTVSLELTPAAEAVTITVPISSALDDAEERGGWMRLRRATLNISNASSLGFRFQGLTIPRGSVIEHASITFYTGSQRQDTFSFSVRAQDTSNSRSFRAQRYNLSLRSKTAARVHWLERTWNKNQVRTTPDLRALVQQVVDRQDWRSGNALTFFFSGNGSVSRNLFSFDSGNEKAPILKVSYRKRSVIPPPPPMTERPVIVTPIRAPQILIGQGPVGADRLSSGDLVKRANLRMLTTWYNGPNDLSWQANYKSTFVPESNNLGYAHHIIVYSGGEEGDLETTYGTACGRSYPLSSGFINDMRKLADIWAGEKDDPPLYFTLFTEFQTYPCKDNAYKPDGKTLNYYEALKDAYSSAKNVIYEEAPNAVVSIGWGGWQSYPGSEQIGEGKAMFAYFDDVMQDSDFVSIQAMDSRGHNPQDIMNMVDAINDSVPEKNIMIAHYKPDNANQETFQQDLRAIFNDDYVMELNSKRVFAFSFMDEDNQRANPDFYEEFLLPTVRSYSKEP